MNQAVNQADSSTTAEMTSASEVYYFWTNAETNEHGITVADSTRENFSIVAEFTLDELSAITAGTDVGGNGEGAAWGDAIVSNDGNRIFVNARNADKVAVIDTATRSVETILDVGDRPVHSFIYEDELWVHVDGDGGFNVVDQETLEVSELIEANTVGTGHGKLLVSEGLGANTYVTNTAEPAVFPINLETREVGAPIEIAGGDPEGGTHDKGYNPATGLAFFQLTGNRGFSFIDAETNEVVADEVPIVGRITHTPDDEYILVLNAAEETDDIGIWQTQLPGHTQPDFDATATVGGKVSVNGTAFYLDDGEWEAWIPQTEGDNVAVLNLEENSVDYVAVGNLTVPEGVRHFSRRGDRDAEHFFTYSDEGALRVDLDTYETSGGLSLGGSVARMAIVEREDSLPGDYDIVGTDAGEKLVAHRDAGSRIKALGGDDIVLGGFGNDVVLGGDGDDVIRGDRHTQVARGSESGGDDVLFGEAGQDLITGRAGNDTLVGGLDDDRLRGDEGDDVLFGGAGNDSLRGDRYWISGGVDMFVFGDEAGTDLIHDFEVGVDKIGLLEGTYRFADLTITQVGRNVSLGASEREDAIAVLKGVSAADITESSFTIVEDAFSAEQI